MLANFEQSLSELKGAPVDVFPGGGYPEPGMASIKLLFANGTQLTAEYWRLVMDDRAGRSSFDHKQQYGLPAPIDAIKELSEALRDKLVTNVLLEYKTGDLLFEFDGTITLQILNFTGYEIWHVIFPDGTGEYSN